MTQSGTNPYAGLKHLTADPLGFTGRPDFSALKHQTTGEDKDGRDFSAFRSPAGNIYTTTSLTRAKTDLFGPEANRGNQPLSRLAISRIGLLTNDAPTEAELETMYANPPRLPTELHTSVPALPMTAIWEAQNPIQIKIKGHDTIQVTDSCQGAWMCAPLHCLSVGIIAPSDLTSRLIQIMVTATTLQLRKDGLQASGWNDLQKTQPIALGLRDCAATASEILTQAIIQGAHPAEAGMLLAGAKMPYNMIPDYIKDNWARIKAQLAA